MNMVIMITKKEITLKKCNRFGMRIARIQNVYQRIHVSWQDQAKTIGEIIGFEGSEIVFIRSKVSGKTEKYRIVSVGSGSRLRKF